jgi:predicted Zn-dependent protease
MTARAAVVVVAVLVLSWLAVMERDERLQARGVRAAQDAQAKFAAAETDFRDARLLNPDTAPDVSRAFLYQRIGRGAEAAELLQDVVRREPDNLSAWALLATFTSERDPGTARRARAQVRRLDPVRARAR